MEEEGLRKGSFYADFGGFLDRIYFGNFYHPSLDLCITVTTELVFVYHSKEPSHFDTVIFNIHNMFS